MLEPLKAQLAIHEKLGGEYFFCSAEGKQVHLSNVRRRVWIPALERAGLEIREIKQARHSFANVALSCGESPLWIASVMGHRNPEMVIKVYTKYVENVQGIEDGSVMGNIVLRNIGNEE